MSNPNVSLTLVSFDLQLAGRPVRSVEVQQPLDHEFEQEFQLPGASGRLSFLRSDTGFRFKLNLSTKDKLERLMLTMSSHQDITKVLCNGYNDWTGSREYQIDEDPGRIYQPVRFLIQSFTDLPFIENLRRNRSGSKRSYGFTTLFTKPTQHDVIFIGSVTDDDAYTFFEFQGNTIYAHRDVTGWLPKSNEAVVDLWLAEVGQDQLTEVYNDFFAEKNLPPLRTGPATGYTSWYYHYNRISPDDIFEIVEYSKKHTLPFDIIQIDDGFQTRVGDWFSLRPNWGDSLRPVVDQIHSAGYKAGLWLAPFIAEEASAVAKDHPDWIAKDKRGRRIKAGFNPLWSYWFYSLDLEHKEVKDYLHQVFQKAVYDWGFDLLKLDFLYAASLQEPSNKTRARHMSNAVALIHDATGWQKGQPFTADKKSGPLLLGCGIPPTIAEGKFDYCRIGSDVKESWEDPLLKFFNHLDRVSTFNSLISTISRHPFNGKAFWNDPDVFYLRSRFRALKDKEKKMPLPMNQAEKITLLLLNHVLGSLVFTSDPIYEYTEKERLLYRRCFLQLQPKVHSIIDNERLYRIEFDISSKDGKTSNRHLLFANLKDTKETVPLPEGVFFRSVAHSDDVTDMPDRSWLYQHQLELLPHHSICLIRIDDTSVIATTGHIFPGAAVNDLFEKQNCYLVAVKDSAVTGFETVSSFSDFGHEYTVLRL